MIKGANFSNACKEVNVILKFVDKDDLRKIPYEFIEIIETNMNKLHKFEYNPNIELNKQEILKETKVIFAYIFLNFWATEKQSQIIKSQFKQDVIATEENKKKQYNPDDMFKKNEISQENKETESNKLPQMVEKENIIKRIFKKIKQIINKNKSNL